jgi:hypothetical protein
MFYLQLLCGRFGKHEITFVFRGSAGRRWRSCLACARDEDINTSDTSTPTHNQISGRITWARAHQQNYQVTSFLASYSSYLDNGNVHSLLLLRNDGHEGNRVGFT